MRKKPGRKRLDPNEVGVCVRLPAQLVARIDAHAAGEFCSRATAIRTALETGLGALESNREAV
jgi:Arc/MetJ-type ribon-helix-helix transcriptional regulator